MTDKGRNAMFEWVLSIMDSWGYAGIFWLMLVEHLFPPIPSEVIMPLAGYLSAQGQMNMALVLASGTAGSVLGTLAWYWVAAAIGEIRLRRFASRHGRLLTLAPADIDTAQRWFTKYGAAAVFLGRMIPAIRTLISVPAGFSRMRFSTFLIYTTLGSLIWTAFLTCAGVILESNYALLEQYIDPVSKAVVVVVVLVYLYRVITWKPH